MSCKYNNCKHCGYKSECEIFKENAENESEARELNIRLDRLIKENAELQHKVDTLQGFLDRDVEFDNLQKENKDLQKSHQDLYNSIRVIKDQINKAKEIIVLGLRVCETSSIEYFNLYQKQAEQFISEVEK